MLSPARFAPALPSAVTPRSRSAPKPFVSGLIGTKPVPTDCPSGTSQAPQLPLVESAYLIECGRALLHRRRRARVVVRRRRARRPAFRVSPCDLREDDQGVQLLEAARQHFVGVRPTEAVRALELLEHLAGNVQDSSGVDSEVGGESGNEALDASAGVGSSSSDGAPSSAGLTSSTWTSHSSKASIGAAACG